MNDKPHIQALKKDFKKKTSTYFDRSYKEKSFRNWLRYERCQLITIWLGEIKKINHIVDVGCGPSILYENALYRCDTYLALDVVEANLKNICASSDKITAVHVDIDDFVWSFKSPPSVVVSQGCLEYTENPSENVKRIIRSLDKEGVFIASFPNKMNPFRVWMEYIHLPVKRFLLALLGNKSYYKRRLFGFDDIISAVESAGGEVVKVKWHGFVFFPHYINQLFPKSSYYLAKWFENHVPFLKIFATEFIIYVKKL